MAHASEGWGEFQTQLAQSLPSLPSGSWLTLKVISSEGLTVQYEASEESGLRLTAPSDRFLDPAEAIGKRGRSAMMELGWLPPVESALQGPKSPASYYREWPHPVPHEEAAQLALETLRWVFLVSNLDDVGYEAFFPGGRFKLPLPVAPIEAMNIGPKIDSTPDELDVYLETYLGSITMTETVERDDRGNFVLPAGSATMFAGTEKGDPASVWLAMPLLWDVEESAELLEVVNEMNTRAGAGRAIWTGSEIVLAESIPAHVFEVQLLVHTYEQMMRLADEYDEILRVRFSGKTSSRDGRPSGPDRGGSSGYL